MSELGRLIRVFISSPGDVAEEREKAREVLSQLQRFYGERVVILPVLWEDLPLSANSSFQEGIDLVLSERYRIDIAVFIMWSRLGSPLGAKICRPDGTPYRSGTEREFDLMLAARERSDGHRPHLLAYVRDDETGFRVALQKLAKDDLPGAIEQRQLAESFIQECFHDERGRNVRAYHAFHDPVSFAHRLRVHLRAMIDEILHLEAGAAATWTDQSPYRGLEVFDIEHAPIFFGREAEVCEVELMLRRRWEEAGCASVVVIGASGSGKSSFVRAGVAHSLIRQNLDEETRAWRCAVILPREAGPDWGRRLAAVLAAPGGIPEVLEGGFTVQALSDAFHASTGSAWDLALRPGFERAADRAGGAVRLLLIVDQLEELFTDQAQTEASRRAFLATVLFLAKTGLVRVILSLRSDFYAAAQAEPAFLELKGTGQFDLLPPGPAAIEALIEQPAALAGLEFDKDPKSGRGLDQIIAEDVIASGASLPLLEYTLDELYQLRDATRGRLTFAAYQGLGGVRGALVTRAERVIGELPAHVQNEFPAVMGELITLGVSGTTERPARRAVRYQAAAAGSEARQLLLDRLISARLLTADRDQDGNPVVMLAHETLLWEWDRLKSLISTRIEFLRFRAQLEEAAVRWVESGFAPSLLSRDRDLGRRSVRLIESGQVPVESMLARYLAESQRIVAYERRWGMSGWMIFTSVMCFLGLLSVGPAMALTPSMAQNLLLFLIPVGWATWNAWNPSHHGIRVISYPVFYTVFALGMTALTIGEDLGESGMPLPQDIPFRLQRMLSEDWLSLAPLVVPFLMVRRALRYPLGFLRLRLPVLSPVWQRVLATAGVLFLMSGAHLSYLALGEKGQELSVKFSPQARMESTMADDLKFQSMREGANRAQAAGKLDEARRILDSMIAAKPVTGNQFQHVADTAVSLGRFDLAVAHYRQAGESWMVDWRNWNGRPNSGREALGAAEAVFRYWLFESNATHWGGDPDGAEQKLSAAVAFARTVTGFDRVKWLGMVSDSRNSLLNWAPGGWPERVRVTRGTAGIWKDSIDDLLRERGTVPPEEAILLQRYGELVQYWSWVLLLSGDYSGCLGKADEAEVLLPGSLWSRSLRASALLLSGRDDEAMIVYRANIGKNHQFQNTPGWGPGELRSWHQFVANDFQALRSAGITHPAMDSILKEIEPTFATQSDTVGPAPAPPNRSR